MRHPKKVTRKELIQKSNKIGIKSQNWLYSDCQCATLQHQSTATHLINDNFKRLLVLALLKPRPSLLSDVGRIQKRVIISHWARYIDKTDENIWVRRVQCLREIALSCFDERKSENLGYWVLREI